MAEAMAVAGSTASGAATGAMVGSVVPGLGTAAGAIIGGAIGFASSMFGGDSGAEEAARAHAKALAESKARIEGISIPEAKRLIVEELAQQGILTPELGQIFDLPPDEVAKIKEDPGARQKQVQALELISARAKGGLTASDRAGFNEMRNNVERDKQAKDAQILQKMQERGMGGSGSELAMQLAQSQSSSQDASEQADRLAATSSQNAIAAATQLGNQAGALRTQDFNQDLQKSTAQNEYNRFKTKNQQDVTNANVGLRNQAAAGNLANKTRIYEANIANRRGEDIRYQEALGTRYNQELSRANALNALTMGEGANAANLAVAKGQERAAGQKSMMDGMTQLGGAYAGGAFSSAPKTSSVAAPSGGYTLGANTDFGDYSNVLPGKYKGGVIEGEANVSGDHPSNDTEIARLSPGEVVLPKSVTESENPAKEASKFMKNIEKQKAFNAASFLTKFLGKQNG